MCTCTQIDIDYAERLDLQMSFSFDGGNSIVRVLEVEYGDSTNFLQAMLGHQIVAGAGINRMQIPEAHPQHRRHYAVKAELRRGEGVPSTDAASGNHIQFESMVWAITYTTLPYRVAADGDITDATCPELSRFVERRVSDELENLILPRGAYKFETTGNPVAENPPKCLPSQTLTYIWHRVPGFQGNTPGAVLPGVLAENIRSCMGKVNDASFDHGLYPAGTLLLTGVHRERETSFLGYEYWTITYTFSYRNNGNSGGTYYGHNHYLNSGRTPPAFERIVHGATPGSYVYETADFTKLFRFTA